VARDWSDEGSVLTDIFARMSGYGANIAAIPYTCYLERRGETLFWVVDLHVKVSRVTEFEVSGEGPTLQEALRRAYLALNNEPMVLSRAAKSNEAFGVAV
jgi:hypothetical protein